jgi:hypothetical protein
MNLNSLIFTSSDYKIAVSCNGVTAPLSIVESFDYGAKKESEYIHVIGTDEPQGLKTNTSTYPGKITIEAGELELFLAALGYVFATQITSATISIVTYKGDLLKIFKNCVFTSHDGSVKAKDKRSLITLSFESTGAAGI